MISRKRIEREVAEHAKRMTMKRRLQGVQGPERHLVGDVAERIPRPDGVEETKSGRRDVGEIVGAMELLKWVDSRYAEASSEMRVASKKRNQELKDFHLGEMSLLIEIRAIVTDTDGQRSDLSNVQGI